MKLTVLLSTIVSVASAALTVTEPSGSHWWVAKSLNTLAWDGKDPAEFSVFLNNPNTNLLTSILALASIVPAYQTSLTMNPGDAKPGTGYTLLLTNPLNSSNIYATSEPFEIKAAGSAYPPQGTVSVNASATAQGTGSEAGSGLSSAPSETTSGHKSGTMRIAASMGAVGAVVVAGLMTVI
ncbi:uncharacterized protein L203_103580 [Cryptococcus depauperatus CBS 7841]|uniref:Uncharacterized protein n=1 Tax=Cryptococcus depauperatus CBS 7841 TaxID=1295531 RepID=A0A1E3IIF2_9TREE|nr:hypothetical protein L203_02823 [Cryptococcus depauperatus CBS 7841]